MGSPVGARVVMPFGWPCRSAERGFVICSVWRHIATLRLAPENTTNLIAAIAKCCSFDTHELRLVML